MLVVPVPAPRIRNAQAPLSLHNVFYNPFQPFPRPRTQEVADIYQFVYFSVYLTYLPTLSYDLSYITVGTRSVPETSSRRLSVSVYLTIHPFYFYFYT